MKIKLIDFGVPEHQRPYRPHGNDAGGCRTNVRQLILYIQHKTPSFEKPGVRGIISLCD
jgi:hypothetical protein